MEVFGYADYENLGSNLRRSLFSLEPEPFKPVTSDFFYFRYSALKNLSRTLCRINSVQLSFRGQPPALHSRGAIIFSVKGIDIALCSNDAFWKKNICH